MALAARQLSEASRRGPARRRASQGLGIMSKRQRRRCRPSPMNEGWRTGAITPVTAAVRSGR